MIIQNLFIFGSKILTALGGFSIIGNPSNANINNTNNNYTGSTHPSYTASTAIMANPERGMYYHTATNSPTDNPTGTYYQLDEEEMTDKREIEGITLILRLFYLNDFFSSNISGTYLTKMQTDFNRARNAGVKLIVRFAYMDSETPGLNNPNKSRILSHITQLASILETNKDVIAVFQAGFLGTWGEWYYTDGFGGDGGITTQNNIDRKEVFDAMLNTFPDELQIQVRYPVLKKRIISDNTAMTLLQAFDGSDRSRIAHHNDAFLHDEENQGTYEEGNVAADRAYVAQESNYTWIGGESNAPDTPYTGCANAESELAELGYTFLNDEYHDEVILQWNTEGCLSNIKKKLGYRYRLSGSTMATTIKNVLPLNIIIVNEGYTTPKNQRNTYLVLKNTSNGNTYPFQLTTDIRLWSNTQNISQNIDTSSVPTGQYSLHLWMPDPSSGLTTNSAYAIQFGNVGSWDSASGYNSLNHNVTIAAQSTFSTSFSVSVSGTVTSYSWQLNTGSGYTTITNGTSSGIIYSGATTSTLNVSGLTTTNNGWTVRAVVSDGSITTNSNAATINII